MKKKNQKSGISLIVLVITIIVIIILAVAVILSISNNNPIDNANKAKNANNEAVFNEAISLALGQYNLDVQSGKIDPKTKTSQEYVKEELIKQGFTEDKLDKLVVHGNRYEIVSQEVADFIKEMDSSLIYSHQYLTGLVDLENNTCYTKERLLTKLPEGSNITYYDGTEVEDTQTIGTGLKIIDKNGNLIAHTLLFGLLNPNYTTMLDYARVKELIHSGKRYEDEKLNATLMYTFADEAGDVNHDGKISKEDCDMLIKYLRSGEALWDFFPQFYPAYSDNIIVKEE